MIGIINMKLNDWYNMKINDWYNMKINDWFNVKLNVKLNDWFNVKLNDWLNVKLNDWFNVKLNDWFNDWLQSSLVDIDLPLQEVYLGQLFVYFTGFLQLFIFSLVIFLLFNDALMSTSNLFSYSLIKMCLCID